MCCTACSYCLCLLLKALKIQIFQVAEGITYSKNLQWKRPELSDPVKSRQPISLFSVESAEDIDTIACVLQSLSNNVSTTPQGMGSEVSEGLQTNPCHCFIDTNNNAVNSKPAPLRKKKFKVKHPLNTFSNLNADARLFVSSVASSRLLSLIGILSKERLTCRGYERDYTFHSRRLKTHQIPENI